MNATNLFAAICMAMVFVGWPIVGKYSQASGAWVATLVMFGTTLMVVLTSGRQLMGSLPTTKGFAVLALAGILNGVAVYFYAAKATDPAVATGTFVVVVAVLMALSAPVLDWALNGSVPTLQKAVGFLCATVAIYLLGK